MGAPQIKNKERHLAWLKKLYKVHFIGVGHSTLAAAEFIRRFSPNCELTFHSDHQSKDCAKRIHKLFQKDVRLLVGEKQNLDRANCVVISPSVIRTHPMLEEAKSLEIPVLLEFELALPLSQAKLVGITGTNGKSTLTEMLTYAFRKLGLTSQAAGNIGRPVCSLSSQDLQSDILVIELSSFMLSHLQSFQLDYAIITNISPDHLDWHTCLEDYQNSKLKIASFVPSKNQVITSAQVQELANDRNFTTLTQDGSIEDLLRLIIETMNLSIPTSLEELFKDFQALPHRLQACQSSEMNKKIYNDSKSTNIESTLFALRQFESPLHLFFGGETKGGRVDQLKDYANRLDLVVLFGSRHIENFKTLGRDLNCVSFPTLIQALRFYAACYNSSSEPLLFSPGGSSYDEFDNFEDRGNFFLNFISGGTSA